MKSGLRATWTDQEFLFQLVQVVRTSELLARALVIEALERRPSPDARQTRSAEVDDDELGAAREGGRPRNSV